MPRNLTKTGQCLSAEPVSRRRFSERWEHVVRLAAAVVGGVPLRDGPQGALLDSATIVLDLGCHSVEKIRLETPVEFLA